MDPGRRIDGPGLRAGGFRARSSGIRGGERAGRSPLLFVLFALALAASACEESGPAAVAFVVTPDDHLLEVGENLQLSAVGAPGPVEWSSSNSSVAQVIPETGFVTGISRGEALISAVSGAHHASARIVVRDPPAIGLSHEAVDFDVTRGGEDPEPRTVEVTNAGDGELENLRLAGVEFGEGEESGWLEAELSGPVAPATLVLRARAGDFPSAFYTAVVFVAADGVANSPQVVSVTMAVLEPPSIVLSSDSVELSGIPGERVSGTVAVTNGGDRPLLDLSVETDGAGWLSASLDRDEAPATLLLEANTEGLDPDRYRAEVVVRSGLPEVEPESLAVILNVSPGPAIGLDPAEVAFQAVEGDAPPPPASVEITNTGGGTLTALSLGEIDYTAGGSPGWLSAEIEGEDAPTVVSLAVESGGLAAGTYEARVPVISPVASNSPREIAVTLQVGAPPSLAVAPSSLTFSAPREGPDPTPQLVNVTNAGGGVLDGLSAHISYTGGGASGWLAVEWEGGVTAAPTRLRVLPSTGSLPPGTYAATVEVRSEVAGVTPRTVAVSFEVVRSFAADVWPIVQARCAGCHQAGGDFPPLTPVGTAYQNLLDGLQGRGPWVIPENPDGGNPSLMCILDWTDPDNCPRMPLPPTEANQLSDADRALIRQWILQGAHP